MTFLVAIGGHTGTGKTTLAYKIRSCIPCLNRAVIIDDDDVRRSILGVDLRHHLQENDYSSEVSSRVTDKIKLDTLKLLQNKTPVINPSGFFGDESRNRVFSYSLDSNATFIGLWLTAPTDVMKRRIRTRCKEREKLSILELEKGHASDADEAVLEKFGDIGIPTGPEWEIIDASLSLDDTFYFAKDSIQRKLNDGAN